MANLGNIVGLLKSATEPDKTYIIWAKLSDPEDLESVVGLFIHNGEEWVQLITTPSAAERGKILYIGEDDLLKFLPAGTTGQILQTNGTDIDPTWVDNPIEAGCIMLRLAGSEDNWTILSSETTPAEPTVPPMGYEWKLRTV